MILPIATLCAHRSAVTCLAWDGASLWSGDETGNLFKWDLNRRAHQVVHRFGDHILAIRLHNEAVFVHLRRGEVFKVHGDSVILHHVTGVDGLFVRMSQIVGDLALVPAKDDAIEVISIKDSRVIQSLKGGGVAFDCCLRRNSAFIAYDDGSLRAFSIESGVQTGKWQPFPTSMTCISVQDSIWMGSPLKDLVALRDGTLHRIEMPVAGVSSILAIDDNAVVVANWDGKIRIVSGMQIVRTISHHSGLINDMLLITDFAVCDSRLPTRMHSGRILVVASADGSISLWDISQFDQLID